MPTLQYNLQDFKNLKDFSKNTKIKYDLIQRRYYSGAAEWKLKHFLLTSKKIPIKTFRDQQACLVSLKNPRLNRVQGIYSIVSSQQGTIWIFRDK